jgi:hypothetical protein
MMNKKEMEGIMDLEWIGLVRKANWTGIGRQTQGRISGEIKNGKIKNEELQWGHTVLNGAEYSEKGSVIYEIQCIIGVFP